MRVPPRVRSLLIGGIALLGLVTGHTPAKAEELEEATTFTNPINPSADPTVVHHDGSYYLSTTQGDRISIWASSSLATIAQAEPVDVWTAPPPTNGDDPMVWAPAMVRLEGPDGPRWYIYFTWSRTGVDADHRMHVLESEGDDPLGPYHLKARLADYGTYAIDGEPFQHNGQLYFAWAAPGRGKQGPNQIYAARMTNPWTVEGEPVALPVGNGGCEDIREGPTPLHHDGTLFLTYSTCHTKLPDYQLWMISIPDGADFLDPSAWTTYPEPIFTRNDAAGVYGPGHHFFFTSPDGSEDWIAYHAKETPEDNVSNRTTRAQQLTWNPDGTPNLGRPLPLSEEIPLPAGDPGR